MRIRAYMVVLALVAAGLMGWRACDGAGAEVVVTPELAGVWKTKSPGHADRSLEIRPREVVFGQADEGEATYPLLGVTRTSRPDGQASYVLRYRVDEMTEAEGTLEVVVGSPGLRIASQPGILWTKER